jgi:cardiolipin synthase
MIVDKKIGFTGGVCLGEEMRNWRESSVRIEGPIVSQMLESFDVMWHKRYHKWKYYLPKNFAENFKEDLREAFTGLRKPKRNPENSKDFQYLTNAPLPGKHYLYRELIRAVKQAKHYIYLTTPYLLPDSRLFRNLKEAANRGVVIRILVPLNTNSILVNIGMGTFFKEMMEHGIEIFRYSASMIHAKTAVVDGSWSTIGSLNLDNLSLRYNFEGNIVSIDKQFAFELEKQFLEDLKMASRLSIEDWNRRSRFRKFLEVLIWPLRAFL